MLEVVEVGLANRSCSMSAQRPRITETSIPPFDTFRKSDTPHQSEQLFFCRGWGNTIL